MSRWRRTGCAFQVCPLEWAARAAREREGYGKTMSASGATMHASLWPPGGGTHAIIVEYLHSPIERIYNIDAVLAVDAQSRGKLKCAGSRAQLPEVIKQLPLTVKDLNHAPGSVHHVEMSLRIKAHSLGTEHRAHIIPDLSDGVLKFTILVQNLHAKIHGVDHRHAVAIQPQFRGE